MEISVVLLSVCCVVDLVIGILIGYLILLSLKGMGTSLKSWCTNIRNRMVDYWYVIVFVITTIFVLKNFKACITLSFSKDFNGMNLIFLIWIALILFPMFESFEGLGISIKKRKQDKKESSLTADFLSQIKTIQEGKEAENE